MKELEAELAHVNKELRELGAAPATLTARQATQKVRRNLQLLLNKLMSPNLSCSTPKHIFQVSLITFFKDVAHDLTLTERDIACKCEQVPLLKTEVSTNKGSHSGSMCHMMSSNTRCFA